MDGVMCFVVGLLAGIGLTTVLVASCLEDLKEHYNYKKGVEND